MLISKPSPHKSHDSSSSRRPLSLGTSLKKHSKWYWADYQNSIDHRFHLPVLLDLLDICLSPVRVKIVIGRTMAEPSGAPSAQEKPKREGNDSLWKRARRTLGASANQLTFMQPQSQGKVICVRVVIALLHDLQCWMIIECLGHLIDHYHHLLNFRLLLFRHHYQKKLQSTTIRAINWANHVAKDTAARTGDASGAGSGKNKRREQVRHAQRYAPAPSFRLFLMLPMHPLSIALSLM